MSSRAKDFLGVVTPEGTYFSEFLGFGPKNAPAASSRMLNKLLSGLENHCMGRIDDILIATETDEEHLKILNELFQRMKAQGIMINAEKTQLFQEQVTFMGYQVDAHGIAVKDFTVEKLKNAELPKSLKELRSFNGLAEWVRPFAKSDVFDENMGILSGAMVKSKQFELTPKQQEAFGKIKTLELVKLVHPDWSRPFNLHTDASEHSIHSILSQDHGIIAYAGRKLRDPEQRRAIPEKELLSVVYAVTTSHTEFLSSNMFTLYTDAKALKYLMDFKYKNSKIFRWSILLSPYNFKIVHVPGEKNPADYGSRYLYSQELTGDWYADFYKNAAHALKRHSVTQMGDELYIRFRNRECRIPKPEQRKKLLERHSRDHIQTEAWYEDLARTYYYPKMYEDLRRIVRSCGTCQKMYAFPTGRKWYQNLPTGPGVELQIDHCGPFKDHQSDRFWILTCVDRFSGKLFATTVETTSIDSVLIYLHEVVFQVLVPTRIHADRAFTNSQDFLEFCHGFGIRVVGGPTSQSQGMVEVMNREIQKKLLQLGVDSTNMTQEGFQVKLSKLVLLHNTTGLAQLRWLSPNEIILGWNSTEEVKSDFQPDLDKLKELLQWRTQLQKYLYEDRKKTHVPEDGYNSGDLILIKMKEGFKRPKSIVRNYGPFLVLKNYGNGLLQVQYSDGQTGDVATTEVIRFAHSQVEGDVPLGTTSVTKETTVVDGETTVQGNPVMIQSGCMILDDLDVRKQASRVLAKGLIASFGTTRAKGKPISGPFFG